MRKRICATYIIVPGDGGRHDAAVIVDHMGVAAGNADGMLHPGLDKHRTHIEADHIQACPLTCFGFFSFV
jgi:hypothetical protein